jgi:hypothetical protein
MFINTLLQQVKGAVNIASSYLVLYYFFPQFALSVTGILVYSVVVGLYIGYVLYASTVAQMRGLIFTPVDPYKEEFNKEIIRCGLEPKNISMRYAYVDDAIAKTFFNLIVVDPMNWTNIAEDPEAIKAREVVEKYIVPGIPENKQELHKAIKASLYPDVQKFIFRHELGHVFYNYSKNIILISSLVCFAETFIVLLWARAMLLSLGGLATLLLSIGLWAILDLLCGYAINFFFKSYEEKKADLFAVRFSSKETIESAANFFEQYEKAAQKYRDTLNSMTFKLPVRVFSGYTDGFSRARYLRDLARSKV